MGNSVIVAGDPEALFGGTNRLLELIETIYGAVSDVSLWPHVLDHIAEAALGQQTFMFTDTADPAMPRALIGTRTDPAALTQLLDYYAAINIFSEPADAVFRDGDIRYSHLVVPDDVLERSEFYNDFFLPFDMHYSYGVNVPQGQAPPVYISCQRPKCQPAFAEREGLVLQTLMPHIERAFTLHRQMGAMRSSVAGLEEALDALDHAVFGLDATGKVVLSNRQAEAIVRAGDTLYVKNDVLHAVLPEQSRELQRLVQGAIATCSVLGMLPGGSMHVWGRLMKAPLQVVVLPVATHTDVDLGGVAALVFVHDPEKAPLLRSNVMSALYGLTPAEGRVADLLLEGLEVRELAARLRITLETARFHVKRVLAKTGARRQSELMRLMLALPGVR